MIQIKYNRKSLCMGDDVYNGIYTIKMPDGALLGDLMEVLLKGGYGNEWPIPHNHDGWLIYSNIGCIARISGDLKHVAYAHVPETTELSTLGIQWVFGGYPGESLSSLASFFKGR